MPKNTVTEISKIANTFFAEAADKTKVKFAGVLKSIEDKETPTGTAKRFKGDFAMTLGDETYRAKYAFFPSQIRDPLCAAISKIGKWDSCEFVFTAVKTVTPTSSSWSVDFSLSPRVEQARVLAMLA